MIKQNEKREKEKREKEKREKEKTEEEGGEEKKKREEREEKGREKKEEVKLVKRSLISGEQSMSAGLTPCWFLRVMSAMWPNRISTTWDFPRRVLQWSGVSPAAFLEKEKKRERRREKRKERENVKFRNQEIDFGKRRAQKRILKEKGRRPLRNEGGVQRDEEGKTERDSRRRTRKRKKKKKKDPKQFGFFPDNPSCFIQFISRLLEKPLEK